MFVPIPIIIFVSLAMIAALIAISVQRSNLRAYKVAMGISAHLISDALQHRREEDWADDFFGD